MSDSEGNTSRSRWSGTRWFLLVVAGVLAGLALIFLYLWLGWDLLAMIKAVFKELPGYLLLSTLFFAAAVGAFVYAITGDKLVGPLLWSGGFLLYGLVAALLLGGGGSDGWPAVGSLSSRAIAFGVVSVALVPIVAAVHFKGDERERSNTTTVLMLWTGVVVFAIAYVAAASGLDPAKFLCSDDVATNCIVESAWPDYLILVGAPGAAAAIAAKGTESNFLGSKSDVPGTNFIASAQYFAFNAIAMVFVLGGLATTSRLGDIPEPLLGLTAASAVTYALVNPTASAASAASSSSEPTESASLRKTNAEQTRPGKSSRRVRQRRTP